MKKVKNTVSKVQQVVKSVKDQVKKEPKTFNGDESVQKLYFDMITTLHEDDQIVKQGLIGTIKNKIRHGKNRVKNLLKGKNQTITDLMIKFCEEYGFRVAKKNGTTKVGTWGKPVEDGQYIVLVVGDPNKLNDDSSQQDFELKLKVLQGQKPNKPVNGLKDVTITLDKGSDVSDIVTAINKQIKPKLGFTID